VYDLFGYEAGGPKGDDTVLSRSLLHDFPHPEMICDHEKRCCVRWEVNVDEWWTHHPDWKVASPNHMHHCFSKYPEPTATFFRKLYRLQWLEINNTNAGNLSNDDGLDIYQRDALPPMKRNCSNIFTNFQVISGMGASIAAVWKGFKTANHQQRLYQLNKHWHGSHWLYVPKDNTSWAWCPTTDLNCYVLPVGNCVNTYGQQDNAGKPR
jgi:hypothetical protein